MLDKFSIDSCGQEISDGDNRSRKVWLLLAYMIYCRNRVLSQEELVNLLWGASESCSNPANALKTMMHRIRSMLNGLGHGAGRSLIVRRKGSYAWNPDYPFDFDVDCFEVLCKEGSAAAAEEEKLEKYLKALELFQGDFLPKLSAEPWVIPVNAYFHNLFVQTVHESVPLLEGRGRLKEAIELCRKAVGIEPCDEFMAFHLIRDLLDCGRQEEAVQVYEAIDQRLFSSFGIMPSDELKALYREAIHTVSDERLSPGLVQEQLREPGESSGALFCDYDFFKVVYHAEARAVARSGEAAHFGLLTVSAVGSKALPRRSLDRSMENLEKQIRVSLRKGDIAARCSVSQFVLLLPRANYENSCKVMERIIKAFSRQYPHSPAALRYSVQPLEPAG